MTIDAEAAEWLVRRNEGLSAREQRAFAAWQARDARHARTFADMARTWEDAASLTHLAHLAPVTAPRRPIEERTPWRRLTAGFASAAVAVGLAIVFGPSLRVLLHSSSYETGVGETRSVNLEDGSLVTLGAKSAIVVAYAAQERRVRLTAGEAFFDVVHRPERPFVVEAGDSVIRDVGTKFNVNRGPDSVRIAVVEGAVELQASAERASAMLPPSIVHAGEHIEVRAVASQDSRGSSAPRPLAVVRDKKVTAYAAWRDGRLVYEDARLGDLAADVNRYYAPGVHLSAEAAELHVTASFRTTEIRWFLDTLHSALPVEVTQNGDGAFEVTRRDVEP